MAQPIIPGSNSDRTGSTRLLGKALREIDQRFTALGGEAAKAFDQIEVLTLGGADVRTIYRMSPAEMERLVMILEAAVERYIISGADSYGSMWWAPYDQSAAQLGLAQSVTNLTGISAVYAAQRRFIDALESEPFRNRVAMAQLKSYEHWTSLGAKARADLAQVIGESVALGLNPRDAKKAIRERLGVSKAQAAAYAQTDITDTLRAARWAEAEHAKTAMGINVALLWTSALLPTTRETHASRHGKNYTTDEVREFYSRDGNRYRCHCSTTECLIENGKPVLLPRLTQALSKEKQTWAKARQKGKR